MKKAFFVLLAVTALATSCKKEKDNIANGIFKGPEVKVYHGKAWTWVQINKNGTPEKLGITLNDAVFNSLPSGTDHAGMQMEANSFVLDFHPKAAITPFKHVFMEWNSHGHPPEPIYGLPHFDFHFYMTSNAEREAIPAFEADSIKFKNFPAPGYMPQSYVPIPGGVPMMGTHWFDVNSPEFNGQVFTETFLYGSYNGKVTFYEPMITLAFLKSITTAFERPISSPAKYQTTGYYPTVMRVVKHDGVTEVVLDNFVYRQQS